MPINYRTLSEILNQIRADIAADIPEIDPTIFGSMTRGFGDGLGNRAFDLQLIIQQLEKMLFPQTAIDEFLERWAAYEGITRNAAEGSDGPVTFEGTVGKTLDAGDKVSAETGVVYSLKAGITFANQLISVTSLTRVGSVVTAVTSSEHQFASNISIDILGANESEYNGTFVITVISETEFTYEITGTPSTPATGTITADFDGAFGEVESDVVNDSESGVNVNLANGAKLTLASPEIGINPTARVQYLGITGGADIESNESLFNRTQQSRSNPVANFNPAAITKECLKVPGVTRVKVKRITPHVGAVTVLFVRDNDSNIIPDAGEVQDVRDVLLAILPAQTPEAWLYTLAPTPVTTNYTFTSISPDTPTMRSSIIESLNSFYRNSVEFETDISEDKYRSAIIDTVDPETGQSLSSFTLSTPSGDITVDDLEIGVLGSVNFS